MKNSRRIRKNPKKEGDVRRKKNQDTLLNEAEDERMERLETHNIYTDQWKKGKKKNDKHPSKLQFLGHRTSIDLVDHFHLRNLVKYNHKLTNSTERNEKYIFQQDRVPLDGKEFTGGLMFTTRPRSPGKNYVVHVAEVFDNNGYSLIYRDKPSWLLTTTKRMSISRYKFKWTTWSTGWRKGRWNTVVSPLLAGRGFLNKSGNPRPIYEQWNPNPIVLKFPFFSGRHVHFCLEYNDQLFFWTSASMFFLTTASK